MAFDLATFLKQGVMPLFGGTQDIIQANLQGRLARLRHQQEMQQLQEMYRMRGEEQEKGHEQSMLEFAERERLSKVEDAMERNRMLLRASFNIHEAEKTSQIHMKATKYEEGLKHEYTMVEERLRQSKDKDPAIYQQIMTNSIKNSIDALATLDGLDTESQGQIMKLSAIANPDPNEQYKPSKVEIDAANKALARLQGNAERNSNYRQIINKHMESFAKNGVTEEGIVPDDRQAFLKKMIGVLEDKMGYRGIKLQDIPMQELVPTLNQLAEESGAEIQFTPADLKFLLANYWSNVKASFNKPKK